MPPDDPLGKNGPSLTDFLKVKQVKSSQVQTPCPYGIKCTYGNKCKFFHADRALNGPQKSITDTLRDHSNRCDLMDTCCCTLIYIFFLGKPSQNFEHLVSSD